jgi:hypothetical protein
LDYNKMITGEAFEDLVNLYLVYAHSGVVTQEDVIHIPHCTVHI